MQARLGSDTRPVRVEFMREFVELLKNHPRVAVDECTSMGWATGRESVYDTAGFYAACVTGVHASTKLAMGDVGFEALPMHSEDALDMIQDYAIENGMRLSDHMLEELRRVYVDALDYACEVFVESIDEF